MNTWRHNLPALVWAISGMLVIFYAFLGLIGKNIPGIPYLVDFLSNLDNTYIYIALILAMFIEGTYIIGNFFPGSSIIVLLVLGKTAQDINVFLGSIFLVFLAWSFSGLINIGLGLLIKKRFPKETRRNKAISTNKWITWFPSFRANYEVSQMIEGYDWKNIFSVSTKIKLITSLFMLAILYVLSFVIDINSVNNQEGFIVLFVVGVVSLFIAYTKYQKDLSHDN